MAPSQYVSLALFLQQVINVKMCCFTACVVLIIMTFKKLYYFPISDMQGWGMSPRGCGYSFGGDIVQQFNVTNNLDFICRAHQLVLEGYMWHFHETVVTVWSAPNYMYR